MGGLQLATPDGKLFPQQIGLQKVILEDAPSLEPPQLHLQRFLQHQERPFRGPEGMGKAEPAAG